MPNIRKKILSIIHPLLKWMADFYLSKPRSYSYKGLKVKIMPSVFHPGLFFSTKLFVEFLETINLKGQRVLELGAGSGLISLFCARNQAIVTASDINPVAIEGIKENAQSNDEKVKIVHSDLFDNLSISDFDIVLINPPYYPKRPESVEEQAWFCGAEFEYFKRLFSQLSSASTTLYTYMILSQDCDINTIMSIAKNYGLDHQLVFSKKVKLEDNFIYKIRTTT